MLKIIRPIAVFSSWAPGAYLDRWSFVHFAWGFMLASFLRMLGFSKKWAYLISLVLMLGWEFAEWRLGSHDYVSNGIMDVVCATAGFWIMHSLWPKVKFRTDALVATSILIATVFVKSWADRG